MNIVPEVALAAIGVSIFKPYFDQANELVNYTFIDEIFHVNQVKEYWNGNFDLWDPKITTPPGLYYLAVWWLRLTGLELSIANLRLLNFVGGVLLIITTLVVKKYHNPGLSALSLFSSPLLTIYYSLFYTDIWSTLLVVQSYVVTACWKPTLTSAATSCLIGSISLLFRQTNIVWLAFALAVIVDKLAKDNYRNILQYDMGVFVRKAFANWRIVTPYAMVLIAFINFVISNGGITMGDKENHVIKQLDGTIHHIRDLCGSHCRPDSIVRAAVFHSTTVVLETPSSASGRPFSVTIGIRVSMELLVVKVSIPSLFQLRV
ncbi:hypothetical protein KL944_002088 [Ogataea haglerorum]|nr:hypothetical protein KL944_002088 [Ogataea haglerorum]